MKKVAAFLVIAFSFACLFAENATYKVKSVSGNVTYEVSNNKWAPVTSDMELEEGAVINTGLNSTLVVMQNGKTIKIKPMKKGKLSELVALSSSKKDIKIGSKVTKEEIAAEATSSKSGVSTASSRASEAKEELDWEE